MNFRAILLLAIFAAAGYETNAKAQIIEAPRRLPPPAPRQTPPIESFSKRIPDPPAVLSPVTREKRQQSYARLLEAQRYIWAIKNRRLRTASGGTNLNVKPAYEALFRAVEFNPALAEAYTAAAELVFATQNDLQEVERLAKLAVRFDAGNIGAHQLLSQIYTLRSGLNEGNLNRDYAEKAIAEWQAITKYDPRNAEAWAFLSEFYERSGETEKAIEALRRWNGAGASGDGSFYRYMTGGGELSPEGATIRLGRALLRANRASEAIAVLSRAVADEPENEDAISALQTAVESSGERDAATAIEALRQAVNANPGKGALVEILADAQLRAGKNAEAAKTLKDAADRLIATDKTSAANLLVKLGGVYSDATRFSEAIAVYEQSLKLMNVGSLPLENKTEKLFAARVVPLVVDVYKRANRVNDARAAIGRLRTLLGNDNPAADIQLVEFLRNNGDAEAALKAAQEARIRFPEDSSLLRLEASVLSDSGRVDEAVKLLRSKIVNKTRQISVPQSLVADFISHLTIADFYMQAGRGADAVGAARLALDLAQNDEMTRIAMLTLASAQNEAGNFREAETVLREILKKEPENPTALNNLGYFLIERDERLPEALDLIKRAVAGEPENPSFLDSLGWAYFRLNRLAEAEKHLTEAARLNPNSAETQNHLGDLYERQGKTEQARAAWRKALSLSKQPDEVAKIRAKINRK